MRHKCYVYKKKIGNHLFAYFFAKRVQQILSPYGCDISFAGISELGVPGEGSKNPLQSNLFLTGLNKRFDIRVANHKPDLEQIIRHASELPIALHIQWPVCNVALLPSVQECQVLVPGNKEYVNQALDKAIPYKDDYLFVHVRAGDILRPIHSKYMPLPIEFIKAAQSRTGLPLLLYGQTSDSWYINLLRHTFPDSVVLEMSQHPGVDFEIGRLANTLMISVSTFAWLSGWLSASAKKIFLPKLGILNPDERPDINLVPKDDPRFSIVSVTNYTNPYELAPQ